MKLQKNFLNSGNDVRWVDGKWQLFDPKTGSAVINPEYGVNSSSASVPLIHHSDGRK